MARDRKTRCELGKLRGRLILLKDAPRHDLIAAVKNAAAGNALLAPSVTIRLIDAFTRVPAHAQPAPSRLASLTAREHDILLRLARGRTNGEIAADLISERHRRGDGHAKDRKSVV